MIWCTGCELQQICSFDMLSPINELNCQWLVWWIKLPVARFLLAVHSSHTFHRFTATTLPRAFIQESSVGYQNGGHHTHTHEVLWDSAALLFVNCHALVLIACGALLLVVSHAFSFITSGAFLYLYNAATLLNPGGADLLLYSHYF